MTMHMLRMPIYNGLTFRSPYPEPCSCCSPAYQMPPVFLNDATLSDPVLRHHANLSNVSPVLCGFDDCPICGPDVPEGA